MALVPRGLLENSDHLRWKPLSKPWRIMAVLIWAWFVLSLVVLVWSIV